MSFVGNELSKIVEKLSLRDHNPNRVDPSKDDYNFYYQGNFTVAVILRKGTEILGVGVAKRHPNDHDNHLGQIIAFVRAVREVRAEATPFYGKRYERYEEVQTR